MSNPQDINDAIQSVMLRRVVDAKVITLGGSEFIESVVLDTGAMLIPCLRRFADGVERPVIRMESI